MFFFKKDPYTMNIKQLVNYITKTYHEPLRKDLDNLEDLVNFVTNNFLTEYPNLKYIKKSYLDFKREVTIHVNREDDITFPTIVKYEKVYNHNTTNFNNNFQIIKKLINDVSMDNDHKHFQFFLDETIKLIKKYWIDKISNLKVQKMIELFKKIQHDMIGHSEVENKHLYYKGLQLQEKLKNKYPNI